MTIEGTEIEMNPVTSSNLAAVGWTGKTGLVVEFVSGSVYLYEAAPEYLMESLRDSNSPGETFFQYVKGKYGYRRVA